MKLRVQETDRYSVGKYELIDKLGISTLDAETATVGISPNGMYVIIVVERKETEVAYGN